MSANLYNELERITVSFFQLGEYYPPHGHTNASNNHDKRTCPPVRFEAIDLLNICNVWRFDQLAYGYVDWMGDDGEG